MNVKSRLEHPKVLKILGAATLLLVVGASWLAVSTAGYMKDVLRDQFNEQQLLLAGFSSQRIDTHLNESGSESRFLNSLSATRYCDPDSYDALPLSTLPLMNRGDVTSVYRIYKSAASRVQELESVVDSVYIRQFFLQALVVFVICFGSLFVALYERRWSRVLEREVAVKTEDIRKYAAQLETSETKYRSLVESAEDFIFTVDRNGLIRTANRHMSHTLGHNAVEIANESLYRFLPGEQVREQLNCVGEVLDSGKGKKIETRLTLSSGNYWFDIQYIPVKGKGTEEYALAIARNVTERKEIEQQLVNAEKLAALGTMAAGVAHEINNPIGIMLGFCDLLLEKLAPGSIEHSDLKTIERHGLHCKSIVERLLSFARMREAGERYCNLNANIESIVSVVRHTLDINNIEVVLALAPDLAQVQGDSSGLQQVFLNLINNAIQAMGEKGALRIETRIGSNAKEIEAIVMDTGCGIRKEHLDKIFDPFFTTKKVGEGTGLGLSVSYGIITRFGGRIECRSLSQDEAPGASGTTFRIILPACSEGVAHSEQ
jgi:PAS domain S-box-containing protein